MKWWMHFDIDDICVKAKLEGGGELLIQCLSGCWLVICKGVRWLGLLGENGN